MRALLENSLGQFMRVFFILVSLFVFQNSILAVSNGTVNLGLNPQSSISEVYTYDEIENSIRVVGVSDDRANRVIIEKRVRVESEVLTGVASVAARGGTATIYRNFGWGELSSIKSAGGKFSIHPNYFQGKQFWVGESGLNMWTKSSFSKPFSAKIIVPKSFVTPGHKNFIFMERNMMIDGFPGGTVLPQNLQRFNSAMKIDWIRY